MENRSSSGRLWLAFSLVFFQSLLHLFCWNLCMVVHIPNENFLCEWNNSIMHYSINGCCVWKLKVYQINVTLFECSAQFFAIFCFFFSCKKAYSRWKMCFKYMLIKGSKSFILCSKAPSRKSYFWINSICFDRFVCVFHFCLDKSHIDNYNSLQRLF